MMYITKLLGKINNDGHKLKVNYRIYKGRYILFMNYRKRDKTGKTVQFCKNIGTLHGIDKMDDLDTFSKAMAYRDEYERGLIPGGAELELSAEHIGFVEYIKRFARRYEKKSSLASFNAFIVRMENYIKNYTENQRDDMALSDINRVFCEGFYDTLKNDGRHSLQIHMIRLRQILNRAVEDGLIRTIPGLKKLNIKPKPAVTEFLTLDEVTKIYKLDTKHNIILDTIRKAFVFSCYTGLRYSDLTNLRFGDVQDGVMTITVQKIQKIKRMILHPVALKIYEEQRHKRPEKSKVFGLLYKTWNRGVKRLMERAGITKRVTGHTARHTFASLLYASGAGVIEIQQLLDHQDVSTSMRYTKIFDGRLDACVTSLPKPKLPEFEE